jgi:hypothetical protein
LRLAEGLSLEELAARALDALGRLVQLAFWSCHSLERLESAAPLMSAIAGTLVRDADARMRGCADARMRAPDKRGADHERPESE